MADLAGHAGAAPVQLTINHNATTETGADEHTHKTFQAATGAVFANAKRAGLHIVHHCDRDVNPVAE